MKVFVTGGTGFIGSYVLEAALAVGHSVCALRRESQTFPASNQLRQPEWIAGNLQTLRADQLSGVDTIIHLASAGVSPKQASWDELVETNVLGSLSLLKTGALAGVRRFVVAGTCHEYGLAADKFIRIPSDAPLDPVTPYGASKAAAFHLIRTFAVEQSLELFYGRIFSAFGDGQFSGNFWPSLKYAAISGNDFPMTSGHQIRDFIKADRVAELFLEACTRDDVTRGLPLTENICTGHPSTLLDFAQQEWTRLGAAGKILPGKIKSRANEAPRIVGEPPHLPYGRKECQHAVSPP